MKLASYIDHTILKPGTLNEDVQRLCREAVQYEFAAVCVPPLFVKLAHQLLQAHSTKKQPFVATVIGFPMGYHEKEIKAAECLRAIADGADELDMVIPIGRLLESDWDFVRADIALQAAVCSKHRKVLKVIIESGLLNREQIRKVCEICTSLKVDFVKTSTGFHGKGAEAETVAFMRSVLPEPIQIKASGGIRDKAAALKMIEAGATRIGASAGIRIVSE